MENLRNDSMLFDKILDLLDDIVYCENHDFNNKYDNVCEELFDLQKIINNKLAEEEKNLIMEGAK